MPAAKRPAKPKVDLTKLGAHVVSVFGPFNSRVLIEMPAERAMDVFPDGLGAAAPALVLEAVVRDLERIQRRDPQLAESTLAMSAVAMAREIEHPYNSATSKSMCQSRLVEAMRELRDLAPPEQQKDGLDDIAAGRKLRLASSGGSASPNS